MSAERLTGLSVSRGIACAEIFRFDRREPTAPENTVCEAAAEEELARARRAETAARGELERRIAALDADKTENAALFRAHLEILDDPYMREQVDVGILAGKSCETSIWDAYAEILAVLENTDDPVFRERAADMKDVRGRLLRCAAGRPEADLSALDRPVILVARELAPSDTACLPREYVMGIATEAGGATSHTAILARSCGIAAVLGVEGLMESAVDGRFAIVDAMAGEVILEPSETERAEYERKRDEWRSQHESDQRYLSRRAMTRDGVEILTEVNLGSVADARSQAAKAADGAGLVRTEFLYMQSRSLPDEQTQYEAYAGILKEFGSRPVILRTLDIGGDKSLSYMELPREDNPFLGLRALRLCFSNEELLRTQLRAAYRASVHGDLWIMFPMVSSIQEFRKAKQLCRQVQQELETEKTAFRSDVKLGIMIEIPSIALAADLAAEETDFASIGTNDLCQYTCAADRTNPAVEPYYRADNPGFLRLIRHVADCYLAAGKPLGVCGEMASDPTMAPILVGLGIRCLSVNAASLGQMRRVLSERSVSDMRTEAEALLRE